MTAELLAYRVWADGTVQTVGDGDPYPWMSDDFLVIESVSEEDAELTARLNNWL